MLRSRDLNEAFFSDKTPTIPSTPHHMRARTFL